MSTARGCYICILLQWLMGSMNALSNETLIVTGWWTISFQTQTSQNDYYRYLSNFKQIKTKKLIFTNDVEFFNDWDREDSIIVAETVEKLRARTGHSVEDWSKMHDRDKDKATRSVELYYILIGRVFLLSEAMELYPSVNWFFWMDPVLGRENTLFLQPMHIDISGLQPDKWIMFSTQNQTHFPCFGGVKIPSIVRPKNIQKLEERCIHGGAYGGHRLSLRSFVEEFRISLDYFFNYKKFAGKDQTLLNFMCVKSWDKVTIYGPPDKYFYDTSLWFFTFLTSNWKTEPYSLDGYKADEEKPHRIGKTMLYGIFLSIIFVFLIYYFKIYLPSCGNKPLDFAELTLTEPTDGRFGIDEFDMELTSMAEENEQSREFLPVNVQSE